MHTMYLVSFTNFAYTKAFKSADEAIKHMERACFHALLLDSQGRELGHFSPITGFHRGGVQ
jgi:hypothetical protein